jgi:hypothetical protein
VEHPDAARLAAGLDAVLASPPDDGRVELIARRPTVDRREIVDRAQLDPLEGLVGDSWRDRGSRSTTDGSAEIDRQLTLMNSRVAALVAGQRDRWALAGDQIYVDLDLSVENLPAGSRLAVGDAVIEITEPPHLGCRKFATRFGQDALRFVNSTGGRLRRFRGVNGRVVVAGSVALGDTVRKLAVPQLSPR